MTGATPTEAGMATIVVSRDIVVKANDVATVHYAARAEPYDRVPSAHAEIIERNGAGRRVPDARPDAPAEDTP